MFKKWLSVVLTVALLIGVAYPTVQVGAEAFSDRISVTATAGEKITIEKSATLPSEDDYNGVLSLISGSYEIERDFAQSCSVTVINRSDKNVEYYLNAQNIYSDIYMNFVRNGSAATPLVIGPGEVQTIKLDIFAQNAERGVYTIPVYAKIVSGEEETTDAKSTLSLICPEVNLNLSLNHISTDEYTLKKTYKLVNHGESLSDVTVSVSGEAKEYTDIDPIIGNYQLDKNGSITFSVSPDLTKMKNNNASKIEGAIVVSSGGKSTSYALNFDTKGKEIVSTTMGKLSVVQSGNMFANLAFVDGTDKVTSIQSKEVFAYTKKDEFTFGKDDAETLLTTMKIEGRKFTGNPDSFISSSLVSYTSEGKYVVKAQQVLDKASLDNLVYLMNFSSLYTGGAALDSISDYYGKDSMCLVEYTLTIEDGISNSLTQSKDNLSLLTYTAIENAVSSYLANPTLSKDEKTTYSVCKISEMLFSYLNSEADVAEVKSGILSAEKYTFSNTVNYNEDGLEGYQATVNFEDGTSFEFFRDYMETEIDPELTYIESKNAGRKVYVADSPVFIVRNGEAFFCRIAYMEKEDGTMIRVRTGLGFDSNSVAAMSVSTQGIVEEAIKETDKEFKDYYDEFSKFCNMLNETQIEATEDYTYAAINSLIEKAKANNPSNNWELEMIHTKAKLANLFHKAKDIEDFIAKDYIKYAKDYDGVDFPMEDDIAESMQDCVDTMSSIIENEKYKAYQSVLEDLRDYYKDELEEYLKDKYGEEKAATILSKIKGYQCTNAGKLALSFKANSVNMIGTSASDNDEPNSSMYVTSRMYGASDAHKFYGNPGSDYVDIGETTYTYTLNGIEVGTSYNSGVTDVAIAQIPVDNLKFGQVNTLICDYDTDPGHYFVNTDTQISIMYPSDTFISYIGSPESLQDVRSLPDFAVYSENIFGSDTDVVIGDKTESSVNIYNRGSFGGWFNIEIKAGNNVVYIEKNSYLDAFSGKTIDFEWTPYSEETDITVTLTNTSIGVDEKDDENNTASRTFKARNRIVPVITAESIGPKFVLEGEGIIFADVAKYNDVTKADFYIDGVLFEGEVKSAVDGDIMRFWINDPSIIAGLREIKVVVTYKSGYDTVSTVTASKKINVLSSDWNRYNFILEDDFKNAKFYIYDIANGYYQKAGYSSHEGDNAAVGIDKDIFSKPDKYLLFVSSDNGFVYKSFADTDVELREATSSVLKIGETDDVYIKETKVKAFDGIETDISLGNNYYFYFTDAVYTLELTYICYGREKTTEVTVDLNMDAEISLVDLADKFVFDFAQAPVSPVATVFYKNTSDASWSTFDLTEKFTGNVMTCFLTDGNIALIDGADEVFVQVVTEDSVFVTEVKPLGGTLKQPISLDKTKLQKYTLDLGDDELLNVKVVCDRFTVYLYKNVIYLQPAEYEITTNFKNGSVGTLSVDDSLSTAAASETAVVSVDWSGAYKAEKANVYGYGESGSDFAVYNYTCASAIDAENDKYLVKTDIFRKNSTYTIESKADASNGKASVKIGDSFAGKITNTFGTYEGGSTVRIYLDKINDSYLNKLTYFNSKSASENFVGYLTLTNVADSSETYKIYVSLDNLSSFDVCLPNISGTYSVKLEVNASPAAEHKKVTDVTVSEKEIKLGLNETYKLSATVYPFDASDKRVTWVSQDTSIATVDSNGVVTASKFNSGSTLISAVTVDGKISASCVATVEYTMFQRILRTLFGELIFRFIMELIY